MAWQLFDSQINGKSAQVLLDDRFVGAVPSESLPKLAWLGIWCQKDPVGAYWHPDESAALDAMENDLVAFAGNFGNGWAAYVRRLATPGLREYYFYFGGNADLSKVLPALKTAHPGYRIEYESIADPKWE